MIPNGPGSPAAGTELELRWRSSRHARRLLTLGLAGLFIAVLARRPEFAGLAAPALLLLAVQGTGRARRRPPRITVRAKPTTRRAFEGERLAVDLVAESTGECSVHWRLHRVSAGTSGAVNGRLPMRRECRRSPYCRS